MPRETYADPDYIVLSTSQMANEIKLKRSAVAGKAPTTSDLNLGELAMNTRDGKVFMKKNVDGTESIVEVGPGTPPQILTSAKLVTEDFTIASGENALSIDEVTVDDGVTVEVPENSVWVVIS